MNYEKAQVVPLDKLTPEEPEPIVCPWCCKQTETTMKKKHSFKTYATAGMWFCCWITKTCDPMKEAKDSDVEWYCDACRNKVAERKKHQPIQTFGPRGMPQTA